MPGAGEREVVSAGAVVLGHGGSVLLVHRPKYDDWSFPKGKLDRGEHATAAAVREVEEETGLRVRLGRPLADQRYPVAPAPSGSTTGSGRAVGDDDVAATRPTRRSTRSAGSGRGGPAPPDLQFDVDTLDEAMAARRKTRTWSWSGTARPARGSAGAATTACGRCWPPGAAGRAAGAGAGGVRRPAAGQLQQHPLRPDPRAVRRRERPPAAHDELLSEEDATRGGVRSWWPASSSERPAGLTGPGLCTPAGAALGLRRPRPRGPRPRAGRADGPAPAPRPVVSAERDRQRWPGANFLARSTRSPGASSHGGPGAGRHRRGRPGSRRPPRADSGRHLSSLRSLRRSQGGRGGRVDINSIRRGFVPGVAALALALSGSGAANDSAGSGDSGGARREPVRRPTVAERRASGAGAGRLARRFRRQRRGHRQLRRVGSGAGRELHRRRLFLRGLRFGAEHDEGELDAANERCGGDVMEVQVSHPIDVVYNLPG